MRNVSTLFVRFPLLMLLVLCCAVSSPAQSKAQEIPKEVQAIVGTYTGSWTSYGLDGQGQVVKQAAWGQATPTVSAARVPARHPARQSAGCPLGAYNVLHLPLPLAERLATDPRFALLTFTGSPAVGWRLKSIAGRKKVVLELGGNAARVVHDDAPDLDRLAQRLALGAFAYAGQVCINELGASSTSGSTTSSPGSSWLRRRRLPSAIRCGSRHRDLGPVIDSAAADRVEAWVEEAIADGATPLLRGHRAGTVLGPTVLGGAPRTAKGIVPRGVRAGRDPGALHRVAERAGRGERLTVRPSGGGVHPRRRQDLRGVSHSRSGRRHRERLPDAPDRQFSLRRREGVGASGAKASSTPWRR